MRERNVNTRIICKQNQENLAKQLPVEQKDKNTDKTKKKLYKKNRTEPKIGGRESRVDKKHKWPTRSTCEHYLLFTFTTERIKQYRMQYDGKNWANENKPRITHTKANRMQGSESTIHKI